MNRSFRIGALLCIFLVTLLISNEATAKRRKTLLEFFKERDVVKVYVKAITNSSENSNLDIKALNGSIEDALRGRISQKFEIVKGEDLADIVMNIEVRELYWTDSDPVDMIIGTAGVAYDVITKECYVRMRFTVNILNRAKKRRLWKERVVATITKKDMPEEESYNLINERAAKVLLEEMFKKPKSKR